LLKKIVAALFFLHITDFVVDIFIFSTAIFYNCVDSVLVMQEKGFGASNSLAGAEKAK
jgi:hypothetical protein